MVSHWYVSPEDRQLFEQKKVSANAANTRYYLGTNFARKYDGEPDADCLYEHIIFLLGDNPIVITRGTKLDPNKEKSSGSDSSTLSFVTQSASYDLVDTGITDSLNIGDTIKVHTNYEDNTQPTTFESPWNEDNCVVTFPTDKTPQYLTEAGVAINTIALAGGMDYTLMYLGEDDGTDVWLVLNPNGIEKKELELINGALLTDTQKLAIYRYLAERNATGERVPNSLGIDYVTYHSETIDDGVSTKIVVKYIDSNIKEDHIESRTVDGNTFFVNEQVDVNLKDIADIKEAAEINRQEVNTVKGDITTLQEDNTTNKAALTMLTQKTTSLETQNTFVAVVDVDDELPRDKYYKGLYKVRYANGVKRSFSGFETIDNFRQTTLMTGVTQTVYSLTGWESGKVISMATNGRKALVVRSTLSYLYDFGYDGLNVAVFKIAFVNGTAVVTQSIPALHNSEGTDTPVLAEYDVEGADNIAIVFLADVRDPNESSKLRYLSNVVCILCDDCAERSNFYICVPYLDSIGGLKELHNGDKFRDNIRNMVFTVVIENAEADGETRAYAALRYSDELYKWTGNEYSSFIPTHINSIAEGIVANIRWENVVNFSSEQIDALNSGITAEKILKYDAYHPWDVKSFDTRNKLSEEFEVFPTFAQGETENVDGYPVGYDHYFYIPISKTSGNEVYDFRRFATDPTDDLATYENGLKPATNYIRIIHDSVCSYNQDFYIPIGSEIDVQEGTQSLAYINDYPENADKKDVIVSIQNGCIVHASIDEIELDAEESESQNESNEN